MADVQLPTNGLLVPPDFPAAPYNSIHKRVVATRGQHPLYEHHAGAWNALAYRFRSLADSGEQFASSLAKHGDSPVPQERYMQEKALFEFYSSGFSVFECTFYGLYAIGAFLNSSAFPMTKPEDQQKVTPTSTSKAYEKTFPGAPILKTFSDLFADPDYQEWRTVRNVLTHRAAPGRIMYVSIGAEDALPAAWKLNKKAMDATLTSNARKTLVRLMSSVLIASEQFVETNLK